MTSSSLDLPPCLADILSEAATNFAFLGGSLGHGFMAYRVPGINPHNETQLKQNLANHDEGSGHPCRLPSDLSTAIAVEIQLKAKRPLLSHHQTMSVSLHQQTCLGQWPSETSMHLSSGIVGS